MKGSFLVVTEIRAKRLTKICQDFVLEVPGFPITLL